jgi:ribosomal protein L37E
MTPRRRYLLGVLAWFALGASILLHQDREDAWIPVLATLAAMGAVTAVIESIRCRACGRKVWPRGKIVSRYLLPTRCPACGEALG